MRAACLILLATFAYAEKIELNDGVAEFQWLSSASFRLARNWSGAPKAIVPRTDVFISQHLKVEMQVPSLKITVFTLVEGKRIVELGSPARAAGKITADRALAPGERIYGRTGASDSPPFLFSSAGFGQMLKGGVKYLVDTGKVKPGRLRLTAQGSDGIEYFFFYGPSPKEIFDQRRFAEPVPDNLPRTTLDIEHLSCETIRALNAESLNGTLQEYEAGERWMPYLLAYIREVHDRGIPAVRPLLMQFPMDPSAHQQADVTMIGDELLVVPRCGASSTVTLPQGLWTDLRTNIETKGRTAVRVTEPLTIFVRNGSILPLKNKDTLELHYFPKLGAEFFLYEPDVNEYSQVHASQATDFWRLEIESKVARTYEWVLHHIGEDPKRIRVEVTAGEDRILNLPL